MLHEFPRSQDASHLCTRLLYDHESVARRVAYNRATLYYPALHVICPLVQILCISKPFFTPDLTFKRDPWLLLYQYLLTRWCIRWMSDYNYYPQAHLRAHAGWLACAHDRTFAIRPIALTHFPSPDHLTTRTRLSLHRTTLAFVAQQTHQDVRHTGRSIAYHRTTFAYWRFRSCVLSYEHFFHANMYKTDCEFLRSHILVASDRETIVKGPLGSNRLAGL